jgi:hypothetical protein
MQDNCAILEKTAFSFEPSEEEEPGTVAEGLEEEDFLLGWPLGCALHNHTVTKQGVIRNHFGNRTSPDTSPSAPHISPLHKLRG